MGRVDQTPFSSVKYSYAAGYLKGNLFQSSIQNKRIYFLFTREYARGVRRTPVKVLKPEEISDSRHSKTTRETTATINQASKHEQVSRTGKRDENVNVLDQNLQSKKKKAVLFGESGARLVQNKHGVVKLSRKEKQHQVNEDEARHSDEPEDVAFAPDVGHQKVNYERAYADDRRLR